MHSAKTPRLTTHETVSADQAHTRVPVGTSAAGLSAASIHRLPKRKTKRQPLTRGGRGEAEARGHGAKVTVRHTAIGSVDAGEYLGAQCASEACDRGDERHGEDGQEPLEVRSP